MAVKFTGKIFFYCVPPGTPDNTGYPHTIICLAEGLRALGIEFYSNINYWQLSPEKEEYLFRHDPKVTPDDCSVVVLNQDWFCLAGRPLPDNLFRPNRKYVTVYMDGADGNITDSWNSEFRQFDFIFKLHYNSKFKYPSNFYPWSQGLSNRMLRELQMLPSFQERKRQLVVNFREPHKIKHSVRHNIYQEFLPHIQSVLPANISVDSLNNAAPDAYHYLQWAQTGRRHSPSYYKSLRDSAACACFGGFFITSWPPDPTSLTSRILKRILSKLGLKSKTIVQWDSWRLWESLAAGCTSFHTDFEKYGFLLPVMPENWRHYVGIDLDNIQEAVDRIADEPEILERISTEGRLWVLENYSPVSTTLRFLETICQRLL
jgi:hypothetical protein